MPVLDPFSSVVIPVWPYFGATPLGHASAFFWQESKSTYLVTNWHVLTGRNPATLEHTHRMAAEPDTLRFTLADKKGVPRHISINLYERETPLWFVHPKLARDIDVAAIRIDIPRGCQITAINSLRTRSLKTLVGSPLFILGYPFEPNAQQAGHLPVWKQGTVATEPDLTPCISPYYLVDSASRPGMSGALVIQRAHGLTLVEAGERGHLYRPVNFSFPVTKLIGIYSGRLHTNSPLDAQLGLVWPIVSVEETIQGRKYETPLFARSGDVNAAS